MIQQPKTGLTQTERWPHYLCIGAFRIDFLRYVEGIETTTNWEQLGAKNAITPAL